MKAAKAQFQFQYHLNAIINTNFHIISKIIQYPDTFYILQSELVKALKSLVRI